MHSAVPERPTMTMPEVEAAALANAYAQANVILEYGSGGSTILAAEMAGKTVFSVESDPVWLAQMRDYFASHPPRANLYLHLGDIGPTKEWSHPLAEDGFRLWPNYPTQIWHSDGFLAPDVVLIDGRFRVACFLTTLFTIMAPTRVLFDDYLERPAYHQIEDFAVPSAYFGRMAQFDLTPTTIPAAKLGWIVKRFLQPF